MSYLYGIPQAKLAEMVGKKIHLVWAKVGSEYTLTKVEGSRIHTLDSFGIKGTFNSKDACYTKRDHDLIKDSNSCYGNTLDKLAK